MRDWADPADRPAAIGGYEDWPAFARDAPRLVVPDPRAQAVADVLGVCRPRAPVAALDPVPGRATHRRDGLDFTRLTWRVGFGPATQAWLVRPTGASHPLPGVLALHAHGGRRWAGADTLVDPGPGADSDYALARRREGYEGRAIANELARSGFAVLAHDAFSWGSRRFDLSRPPPKLAAAAAASAALRERDGSPAAGAADAFDTISAAHEDLLAKTAGVLGTSFAGTVVADDLAALDVLAGLDGVDADRIAAIGFSGGGARAHYLGALDARVRAVVIACMMATFSSLVPDHLETHSWLLHSPGLARLVEWPELGAIAPDARLPHRRILALYGESDPLFDVSGMRDAHRMLAETATGYEGRFHPTGHAFTAAMQREAVDFLRDALR